MMNSRISLFIAAGLIIPGAAIFACSTQNQEPARVFPAAVNRDCTPWDGAAFTVRIPLENGDVIDISIWQSPDITFPTTFSFSDDSATLGNAILIRPVGLPGALSGEIRFQRVDQSQPVEGELDLADEFGNQFKGPFEAQWEDKIILCG